MAMLTWAAPGVLPVAWAWLSLLGVPTLAKATELRPAKTSSSDGFILKLTKASICSKSKGWMDELHSNFMDEYRAGAKQLLMLSGRIMHTVGSHVEHMNFEKMVI
jgi:hypothetical protein